MKRVFVPVFLIAALVGINVTANAQDTNDGIAQVWHFVIKDGMNQEFEAALIAYHEHWNDAEGRWPWTYYQAVTGPETGDYFARSGGHNWADFDVERDWDEEANEMWTTMVGTFIASTDGLVTRTDADLSDLPEDGSSIKYAEVENWYVRTGQGAAFYQGLKTIAETLKEANWGGPWAITFTEAGGNASEVGLVGLYESWADMKEEDPGFMDVLMEKLGAEAAQELMSSWGQTFRVGEVQIFAIRPDLSY